MINDIVENLKKNHPEIYKSNPRYPNNRYDTENERFSKVYLYEANFIFISFTNGKKISGTDLHFILESSDQMNKSLQFFFTLLLCIKQKQTERVANYRFNNFRCLYTYLP